MAVVERIRDHCRVVIQHLPTHPVMGRIRSVGLGTVAVTGITSSILAPVISEKFPTTTFHYVLIQGFLLSTASLWLGYVYEDTPVGPVLELFGITGMLLWSCLTLGNFLPITAAPLCWFAAIILCMPLLDVIINPRRGAPAADPVQVPRRVEVV